MGMTTPNTAPIRISSLAALKRVLAEPDIALTFVSMSFSDGRVSKIPHHVEITGKPRTIAAVTARAVGLRTLPGQTAPRGEMTFVSWLKFGKASEWTFTVDEDGRQVISKGSDDTGWITYIVERFDSAAKLRALPEGLYNDGVYDGQLDEDGWTPIHAPYGMPSAPEYSRLRRVVVRYEPLEPTR